MEYGMAAEPSALGAKIKFWEDNTPSEYHTLYHIEDLEKFPPYEVENDAFMAMTLHRIRMQRQRILDTGEILPMVTSRGPMCTAGFVRGTTDLMIDLVEKPEWTHKLLDLCTQPHHRLAQGPTQGDGRYGRGDFCFGRHRGLCERGALQGILSSVSETHLRCISQRTG